MAKTLTAPAIEKLKPGPERREIPDARMPGLYLIIQPTGAKSWAVRYRHAGRSRKFTIGTFPAYDLTKARKKASDVLTAAGDGKDPARQKLKDREAAKLATRDLFAEAAKGFIAKKLKRNGRRSWRETARLLGLRDIPDKPNEFELIKKPDSDETKGRGRRRTRDGLAYRWRNRSVTEITKRDITDELDALAPVVANRTLGALKNMFNWLIERGVLTVSPCEAMKPPTDEESRERVLTDDEIRLLWKAADDASYPFGPFAKLLLLTAARREEVAAMTEDEIDLDAKTWKIPKERAKNNEAHEIPLSDSAIAVIESLPKISGHDGLLFTMTGVTPISGFSKARGALHEKMSKRADAAEIDHWTFHDLRRTAASGMAKLNVAPHVIEAVLNHRTGTIKGIARVYNRNTYEPEKRVALEAWARYIEHLLSDDESAASNVVRLARA